MTEDRYLTTEELIETGVRHGMAQFAEAIQNQIREAKWKSFTATSVGDRTEIVNILHDVESYIWAAIQNKDKTFDQIEAEIERDRNND